MNLLEAIQGAGENWFRPVAWRDGVFMFKVIDGFVHCYDQEYMPTDIQTLTGEWEIVTPEKVLAERKL